MADSSAMKSYQEKNNLEYYTFSPNFEKFIKAVIRHLPPDTPAEDIPNSLEGLGFNVINVKQLMINRRAPNGQTHMETLPLFLATLIRNAKSQEIFKPNSLNHVDQVDSYRIQTGLTQCCPRERRRAQRAPNGPSPQHTYAAALHQDKQHQQPQTTQTEQQYLTQKEFQKTSLSIQAPSSSNNETVATVVHQIMTELTKAVLEEDRVMAIKKLILN
jgi:hypothetical protein